MEGGLCKFLHFKPIPGERERIITLEPPAILTGRLVSEAGEPLRDMSINCSYAVGYNWVFRRVPGGADRCPRPISL